MWGKGARTWVLLLNAANVSLCQHQHPTDVLNATVSGGGKKLCNFINAIKTLKIKFKLLFQVSFLTLMQEKVLPSLKLP